MARSAGEKGFTLAELLVALAIFGMVCAAIFGIYLATMQSYTRAVSLQDAQVGARYGLDRMATELRLAGSYWTGPLGGGAGLTAANATSVSFRGDIDGDTVNGNVETTSVGTTNPGLTVSVTGTAAQVAAAFGANESLYIADGAGREVRAITSVAATIITLAPALVNTYSAGSIVRSVESVTYAFDAAAQTLTRSVGGGAADPIVGNVTGLALTYVDTSGNVLNQPVNAALVEEIEITLTTQGNDGSARIMTSRVRLRN